MQTYNISFRELTSRIDVGPPHIYRVGDTKQFQH